MQIDGRRLDLIDRIAGVMILVPLDRQIQDFVDKMFTKIIVNVERVLLLNDPRRTMETPEKKFQENIEEHRARDGAENIILPRQSVLYVIEDRAQDDYFE
jgi:hypothetical protein